MSKSKIITKIYQTIPHLLTEVNDNDYDGACNRIQKYLKNNIRILSKTSVILKVIMLNDANKHYALLEDNGSNPPMVTGNELHTCGAVQIPCKIGNNQNVTLLHIKTTLFNALLMIPGAEVVAEYMMDHYPQGQFNDVGVFFSPALHLVLPESKGDVCHRIAKKLIDRGGFDLNTYELDRATGQRISLLERIAESKNYELLEYMLQNKHFDFNALYKVYGFGVFKKVTPLMLIAQLADVQALQLLLEHEVDATICVKPSSQEVCNAISFAKTNMDIILLLLDHGCEYLGTTVGVSTSLHLENKNYSDIAKIIQQYAIHMDKLLAERAFVQKSLETIENNTTNADILVEQKYIANNHTNIDNLNIENESLDSLLLRYFLTKDESLGEQIALMCLDSQDLSLKLISMLNTDYIDYPNIEKLVHNVLYDQALMHKYFVNRKSTIEERMHQIIDRNTSNQDAYWLADNQEIRLEDVIFVKSTMQSDLYIQISNNLLDQIDINGLDNLKVLSKNSLSQNGIKFRNDKGIIVLKTQKLTDNDIRLVAEGFF